MNRDVLFEKSERLRLPFITASLAVIAMTLGMIRLALDGQFSAVVAVQVISSLLFAVSSLLFRTRHSGLGIHTFLATGTLSVLGMVFVDDGMQTHVMVWLPLVPFLVAILANYKISVGYTLFVLIGIAYLSFGSNGSPFVYFSLALGVIFSCGVGIFLERTRMTYERKIAKMATSHALTKLPSRVVFDVLLDQATGRLNREGVPFALVFIDVDRLKYVNDTFGHPAGDELLKEVAKRLAAKTRESESLFHISGDEFVMLVGSSQDLEPLKTRIRAIKGEFIYMDFRIPLSVSVGAAHGTDTSEKSLLAADNDMYVDKRSSSDHRL